MLAGEETPLDLKGRFSGNGGASIEHHTGLQPVVVVVGGEAGGGGGAAVSVSERKQ